MGLNFAGIRAVASLCIKPRQFLPHLIVPDIRSLDFVKLRALGINAVIFDKDNCLTKPHSDTLAPALSDSWQALQQTIPNILIVSNSAGTRSDNALLAAENVARNLKVSVLVHKTKKPGCAKDVERWCKGEAVVVGGYRRKAVDLVDGKARILVVGDRLSTDIILAHRLNRLKDVQAFGCLTTSLWAREGPGTWFMRNAEWGLYRFIKRATKSATSSELEGCVIKEEIAPAKPSRIGEAISRIRTLGWKALIPTRIPFLRSLESLQSKYGYFSGNARQQRLLSMGWKLPDSVSRLSALSRGTRMQQRIE